jgi:hypothetical protein
VSKLTFKPNFFCYVAPILMTFCLGFTACTQGQGPGEPAKVTTAGAQAPVDTCENPENINNSLCQWVVKEIGSSSPTSDQTKIVFTYDDQGRISQLAAFDKEGKKDSYADFTYDHLGYSKVEFFSEPNPKGSENFSQKMTKTVLHNPQDGSIASINWVAGTLSNGQFTEVSSRVSTFVYSGSKLTVTTIYYDAQKKITNATVSEVQKDGEGRIESIIGKEGDWNGTVIDPLNTWVVEKVSYTATGRLDKWEKQIEYCSTPAGCDTTAAIVPNEIDMNGYTYDDQDRMTRFFQTKDGGYNSTPDNSIDGSNEFDFSYDSSKKEKIAGEHPFSIIFGVQVQPYFGEYGFNNLDIFSTLIGQENGQPSKDGPVHFDWVRLWEVLPEGKAPGS